VKVRGCCREIRSAKDQEPLCQFEAAAVRNEPDLGRYQRNTGIPWCLEAAWMSDSACFRRRFGRFEVELLVGSANSATISSQRFVQQEPWPKLPDLVLLNLPSAQFLRLIEMKSTGWHPNRGIDRPRTRPLLLLARRKPKPRASYFPRMIRLSLSQRAETSRSLPCSVGR
jgi:hypothetical protein